jgi:hypothetical protein
VASQIPAVDAVQRCCNGCSVVEIADRDIVEGMPTLETSRSWRTSRAHSDASLHQQC